MKSSCSIIYIRKIRRVRISFFGRLIAKPLHVKKLERWREAVRERVENMLPNTPAAALLSSEALNVVTPAAHSVGAEESECESGAENESECDREEDDDDSDDDLEIVSEQSGTADSTGASSAGTDTPAKKAKITLTAEQEEFAKKFHPAASKIDRPRKIPTLAGSIKSFEERKDSKGKDTFDLSDWWKSNSVRLPGFAYVLRTVLTNSPNSCPPERLFSLFNTTYNDDQKSAYGDYIELSMQSQFNKRGLR